MTAPIIWPFSQGFANKDLKYNPNHINLWYCHIHDLFEVCVSSPHRVCFECGHVYNTPADLEKAYARVVREMNLDAARSGEPPRSEYKPADEIFFCQECIHDF